MKSVRQILCLCLLLSTAYVQAEEVIRLGNLKLAHFGAVSYMKEIAPQMRHQDRRAHFC